MTEGEADFLARYGTRIAYLFIVLALMLGVTRMELFIQDVHHQSQVNLRVLCALKAERSAQLDRKEDYLKAVLAGLRDPVPGIRIEEIQADLAEDQAVLRAYSPLECRG